MNSLNNLLENNKNWANKIKQEEPDFFKNLADGQDPDILWIGCSDSRVPTNQIVNLPPGEIFVHRNIANVIVHTDLNCLSVIQYAVEVLKVKHIIVCGHYGCGGVKAAIDNEEHGLIDNWLLHIKDVSRLNAGMLKELSEAEKIDRLCELNVIEQLKNLCSTSIVQKAWKSGADLTAHGWIYNMEDGHIKDMSTSVSSVADFEKLMAH